MTKEITTPEERLAHILEEQITSLETAQSIIDMLVQRVNDLVYMQNNQHKRIEALEARNGSLGDK